MVGWLRSLENILKMLRPWGILGRIIWIISHELLQKTEVCESSV